MKGDKFEIRLYEGRVEVHHGSQSTGAWMPKWSHLFPIPGGTFPDAVAAVRTIVDDPGTGSVVRYAYMSAAEAHWRKRYDVAEAGGGEVVVNQFRVQLRPKGRTPEPKRKVIR